MLNGKNFPWKERMSEGGKSTKWKLISGKFFSSCGGPEVQVRPSVGNLQPSPSSRPADGWPAGRWGLGSSGLLLRTREKREEVSHRRRRRSPSPPPPPPPPGKVPQMRRGRSCPRALPANKGWLTATALARELSSGGERSFHPGRRVIGLAAQASRAIEKPQSAAARSSLFRGAIFAI